MKVAIVGTGYVGLVTGVCLAELGHDVSCIDSDTTKIALLEKGESPIFEPGLSELITKNQQAGCLHFASEFEVPLSTADAVFIAVGTPPSEIDGQPDMSQMNRALPSIARALKDNAVLIVKSTVPVGTTRSVADQIRRFRPDASITLASNPEFLRQGNAVVDFMHPDRIVAGIDSPRTKEVMEALYAPLTAKGAPLVLTTFESSEMIKYAANTMLAAKIAFINEIADICEQVGANILHVARAVGMDKRIGDKFLQPGPGFGGSCFPKDTMALKAIADSKGVPAPLVSAVISSNVNRKFLMLDKIISSCGGSVDGKTIAVFGLTFKPGTDDMRESVSLTLVPALADKGAKLRLYDPQGMDNAKREFAEVQGLEWCEDVAAATKGADACIVITEWDEIKNISPVELGKNMKHKVMIDLRNCFRRKPMQEAGFTYISIGRAVVYPEQDLPKDMVASS